MYIVGRKKCLGKRPVPQKPRLILLQISSVNNHSSAKEFAYELSAFMRFIQIPYFLVDTFLRNGITKQNKSFDKRNSHELSRQLLI